MNTKTMQHMQKENRRKPSVFAGFLAGAEGLVSAAASVGAGRSPQATSAPRHAPQESLRPHFIAKSFRTLTKKPGTAKAIPDYFGSGKRTCSRLPAGVLLPSGESPAPAETGVETGAAERHRWLAPLGTRFWSGCGNTPARAEEGRCCPVPSVKPPKGGANLVLRGE